MCFLKEHWLIGKSLAAISYILISLQNKGIRKRLSLRIPFLYQSKGQ